MKALIVDDEKHVREAISLLIDWSSYQINEIREASNGATAIDIITEWKPEIIFTDMMMPGIDGCELLTWIQANAPSSKTIVISGHDDFQLVRHTMTTGGVDYILKPIDEEQLNTALRGAVELWKEEDVNRSELHSRNIEVNLLKPIYWEKLCTELIQHPQPEGKKFAELLEEFPEVSLAQSCTCSLISLHISDEFIAAKYQNHRDLLFFTLINIANEILRTTSNGFAFRHWASEEEEIVLLHWGDPALVEKHVKTINDAFYDTLGTAFHIGTGLEKAFPQQIQQAYREAKLALQQRNVHVSDQKLYFFGETRNARISSETDVIIDIQKYIESNYNAELSLQQIAATFYLSREYISRRFKQKTGVNVSEYLEQIRIEKAKQYLLNPDAKIGHVAGLVGYKDEKYFSRVFKKLTGCSPNTYKNKHLTLKE